MRRGDKVGSKKPTANLDANSKLFGQNSQEESKVQQREQEHFDTDISGMHDNSHIVLTSHSAIDIVPNKNSFAEQSRLRNQVFIEQEEEGQYTSPLEKKKIVAKNSNLTADLSSKE